MLRIIFILLLFSISFSQTINDLKSNDLAFFEKFEHWYTGAVAGDSSSHYYKLSMKNRVNHPELAVQYFKYAFSFSQKNDRYNLSNTSIELNYIHKLISSNIAEKVEEADKRLNKISFSNTRNVYVKKFTIIKNVLIFEVKKTKYKLGILKDENVDETLDKSIYAIFTVEFPMLLHSDINKSGIIISHSRYYIRTNTFFIDGSVEQDFEANDESNGMSFGFALGKRHHFYSISYLSSSNSITSNANVHNSSDVYKLETSSISISILGNYQIYNFYTIDLFGKLGLAFNKLSYGNFSNTYKITPASVVDHTDTIYKKSFYSKSLVFGLMMAKNLTSSITFNISLDTNMQFSKIDFTSKYKVYGSAGIYYYY